MWNMKFFVIPVITEAMGLQLKDFKKSGNNTRTILKIISTKRTPYEEHHTSETRCYNLRLEA
jgi:hypothetical protein